MTLAQFLSIAQIVTWALCSIGMLQAWIRMTISRKAFCKGEQQYQQAKLELEQARAQYVQAIDELRRSCI